jgi:endonuclease/exonuclease/phosphatase (EEP) superfamily protein YafD
VAAWLAARDGPAILLGDLNCVSWSPPLRRVCREGRMKDARKGFGVCATWPAPYAPLGCPIDHCLVSPEIHVRGFRTGANLGSDHLPIVVDFTLSGAAKAPPGARATAPASQVTPPGGRTR